MPRWCALVPAGVVALGCAPTPTPAPGPAQLCSRLHRDVAAWEGEPDACGADPTLTSELTAIGHDFVLQHRRFLGADDLWQLGPDGLVRAWPNEAQATGEPTAALTLLPGPTPRVLVTNPRMPSWLLYNVEADPVANALSTSIGGDWPATIGTEMVWKGPRAQPWGHEFVGLDDTNLLDRDLGDGSTRVWRLDSAPGATPLLTLRPDLVGGAREAFVRGHHLVYLAPGLLLEWSVAFRDPVAPRPADCAGALAAIWTFTLDDGATPRDPLGATPVWSGCWPTIGAGHDITGDGEHLFVRERATGELATYAVTPAAIDPLAAPPVDTRPAGGPEAALLKSLDWTPPTQSSIRHLVLIVQDGRSFDAYFGRACTGTPSEDGTPLAREDFPAGCEAIPASPPGAPGGCAPLDATADAHAPNGHPVCMRDKMDGDKMDAFANTHLVPCPPSLVSCLQETCGDPLDIACAGSDDEDGALAPVLGMAMQGALADRMFQTFAYLDGPLPPTLSGSDVVNLLFLGAARFVPDIFALDGTPFLTTDLGTMEVPWTFYAGSANLRAIVVAPTVQPDFHDPVWYPYRSLESGELERDIDLGQLPPVSVVLADASDTDRGEGPGHSPANGIAFVRGVADAIAGSPYGKDTLVLLTYVTGGGYYDHVRPPPPIGKNVDAVDGSAAASVPYGPRVPMLALGPFARGGHVSHVQLEMSSLAVFIEWNWLQSRALKVRSQPDDMRRYRDTAVNNIGSLLDPGATGEPHVPAHRED
jgi:hypothetical protein